MLTQTVELPSGIKAVIRPIGFAARKQLEHMTPSIPPKLTALGLRANEDLEKLTMAEFIKREPPELISAAQTFGDKYALSGAEAQVYQVCACTVKPRLTPETIDDILDEADFLALESAIVELHKSEAGASPLPFPRGRAVSSNAASTRGGLREVT